MSYKNVSKGIDINKTNKSKECILRHYWYFKDINFKFQTYIKHILLL